MKRVKAYFSGNVQGVGFRFTCQRMASALNINGWVKNLDDLRVELVAEGSQKSLDNLIHGLKERFSGYINDVELNYSDAAGDMDDFKIVF